MRKKAISPQTKHEQHEMIVEPTTRAHHKFVMRCADCRGAFIKWATATEYEIYLSLQSDNSSDAI